jgi:hypothetical protein
MTVHKCGTLQIYKQKAPIPYQFQSVLWAHQPRLCHRVLFQRSVSDKIEPRVETREGGREGHNLQNVERERERESILFKKLARVPSVTDSPMKGTTASTLSPIEGKTRLHKHIMGNAFMNTISPQKATVVYHYLKQMTDSKLGTERHSACNNVFSKRLQECKNCINGKNVRKLNVSS